MTRLNGAPVFQTQDSDFIKEQTQTWIKLGDAKWGKGGRKTNIAGLADGMQNLRFGYLKVCLESNYLEHKYNNFVFITPFGVILLEEGVNDHGIR